LNRGLRTGRGKGLKLENALDLFILEQTIKGNTEKTKSGYKKFIAQFILYLHQQNIFLVEHITLHLVNKYQLYLHDRQSSRDEAVKLRKRTIQTYIRHIKIFMKFLYEDGHIKEPIYTLIKLPKAERPVIEILTADEINTVLTAFTKSELGLRNTLIVHLFIDCGLRLSEVAGLETQNINIDRGYIKVVGKGRKERIIPIGIKLRRVLILYITKRRKPDEQRHDKYLFMSKDRLPISTAAISTLITRLKRRTHIYRLHPHLFRHTFATNFLVHGLGDVYELSRILGHADIKITEKYLQLASYYTIIEKRRPKTYLDNILP